MVSPINCTISVRDRTNSLNSSGDVPSTSKSPATARTPSRHQKRKYRAKRHYRPATTGDFEGDSILSITESIRAKAHPSSQSTRKSLPIPTARGVDFSCPVNLFLENVRHNLRDSIHRNQMVKPPKRNRQNVWGNAGIHEFPSNHLRFLRSLNSSILTVKSMPARATRTAKSAET